ncbi:MAG TPA: nuclear transport factor 2 family protein, partial [Acidimicrobiales bacterium]|nr:nuclear transport factor 2 family protein [Acidimicrobiales bacterium]
DNPVDKQELAELIAVLSSAVDRGDRDRIASCYTEDSFDDHGTFKGSGEEFADFVCGPGPMSSMHHLIGQSIFDVDVDGDEAWGETFYVFHGTVGTTQVTGHGRYIDYFRCTGGSWKLAYRRVVPESVPAGDDAGAYWRPTRDCDDPAYDRLRAPDGDGPERRGARSTKTG